MKKNLILLALGLFSKIKLSGSAKLEDGTEIHWDSEELGVGSVVATKDADGNATPLPTGTYKLEDGSTLDIVDGEVKGYEPGAGDEPGKDAPPAADLSEYVTKADLADVVGKITEMFEQHAAQLVSTAKTEMTAQIKGQPAATPAGKGTPAPGAGTFAALSAEELNNMSIKDRALYLIASGTQNTGGQA